MTELIRFEGEQQANTVREQLMNQEPVGLRTYTPTQAVIEKSAGLYHWTPDGRRLADFTSGVLVANLGHNPKEWMKRFAHHLRWDAEAFAGGDGYAALPPLTTYNAISTVEAEATDRLLRSMQNAPGGRRMERVLWSASGSEGIQKALWACLHFQPSKDIILATRNGFHGKKGLAGAVTGDENSPDRDPRVKFIGFPKAECQDLTLRDQPFDPSPYREELEQLKREFPNRLNCLITEPYLGGGGSYHPPKAYVQMLVEFCRENDIVFILDEVQANFGRCGTLYAFEAYGVEPDIVVLGKGMGNGVPVNAAVGRADVFGSLNYGEGSDTWSGHPLGCASLLATLDIFEQNDILGHANQVSKKVEAGLVALKKHSIVEAVRGEGMVWGVQFRKIGSANSHEVANAVVRQAYLGDDEGNAIHLLGPLAGNVIRISPPLTMTLEEADHWFAVLDRIVGKVEAALS